MSDDRPMYVRYLGTKACWTTQAGNFYIGDRKELTEEERVVCDKGGGYMPENEAVVFAANMAEWDVPQKSRNVK